MFEVSVPCLHFWRLPLKFLPAAALSSPAAPQDLRVSVGTSQHSALPTRCHGHVGSMERPQRSVKSSHTATVAPTTSFSTDARDRLDSRLVPILSEQQRFVLADAVSFLVTQHITSG